MLHGEMMYGKCAYVCVKRSGTQIADPQQIRSKGTFTTTVNAVDLSGALKKQTYAHGFNTSLNRKALDRISTLARTPKTREIWIFRMGKCAFAERGRKRWRVNAYLFVGFYGCACGARFQSAART